MIEFYIKLSFILLLGMSIFGILGLIPLLLLQHLLHKNTLDPTYFNDKYYSPYELEIFTTFPLFLLKTLGYIKAITFPNTMRLKFQKDILDSNKHPIIFLTAWFTMLIIIFCGFILINTLIMAIVFYSYN